MKNLIETNIERTNFDSRVYVFSLFQMIFLLMKKRVREILENSLGAVKTVSLDDETLPKSRVRLGRPKLFKLLIVHGLKFLFGKKYENLSGDNDMKKDIDKVVMQYELLFQLIYESDERNVGEPEEKIQTGQEQNKKNEMKTLTRDPMRIKLWIIVIVIYSIWLVLLVTYFVPQQILFWRSFASLFYPEIKSPTLFFTQLLPASILNIQVPVFLFFGSVITVLVLNRKLCDFIEDNYENKQLSYRLKLNIKTSMNSYIFLIIILVFLSAWFVNGLVMAPRGVEAHGLDYAESLWRYLFLWDFSFLEAINRILIFIGLYIAFSLSYSLYYVSTQVEYKFDEFTSPRIDEAFLKKIRRIGIALFAIVIIMISSLQVFSILTDVLKYGSLQITTIVTFVLTLIFALGIAFGTLVISMKNWSKTIKISKNNTLAKIREEKRNIKKELDSKLRSGEERTGIIIRKMELRFLEDSSMEINDIQDSAFDYKVLLTLLFPIASYLIQQFNILGILFGFSL